MPVYLFNKKAPFTEDVYKSKTVNPCMCLSLWQSSGNFDTGVKQLL
jgi:hypothetical protein